MSVDQISIRIAPHNHAAYVTSAADRDGLHHGHMKHSDRPVTVRWNETSREWEETEESAAMADRWQMDPTTEEWRFR